MLSSDYAVVFSTHIGVRVFAMPFVRLLTMRCRSSGLNSEVHNEMMDSQINVLKGDIQQILRILADQKKISIPEATAIVDPLVNRNLEACVQSAGKIVSSAASIVYERSVSGSKFGGSELGELLPKDKRERINAWIPENTTKETHIVEPDEIFPFPLANRSEGTISSRASDSIFSPTGSVYTAATSPVSEYSRFKFDDRTIEIPPIDEVDYNAEMDLDSVQSPTTPISQAGDSLIEREEGTGGVTLSRIRPTIQIKTAVDMVDPKNANPTSPIVDVSHTDAEIEDDFILKMWERAMVKFREREFAAAESLLEVTLKESEARHGTKFAGNERILQSLASACAHHGRKERVEEILDKEYPGPKHNVLATLITTSLGEGKLNQASEILEKYGSELEGKNDALHNLLSACVKHSCWSVAAEIFSRYSQFRGREMRLKECVSVCRHEACWREAEGFLLELLKVQTPTELEWSATMHQLAEVYIAKNDLNKARDYCRRAFDARRSKKNAPLVQESLYLLAKIIYEVHGDPHEFELYRDQLPSKVRGICFYKPLLTADCLELELLSRMHPSQAAQQLGTVLLKNLNRTPSSDSFTIKYVDLDSVRQTIKVHGAIGATVARGDTLLHVFAESGNERAVQQLLDQGARISTSSKSGRTALYLAVEKAHEQVVNVLLKNGATVDDQDSPQNPLFLAAITGHVGSLLSLLKYRQGPGPWMVPEMLLQTAVKGHAHVLQLLLENGAKDVRRVEGGYNACFRDPARPIRARTALHEAVARGFSSGLIDLLSNDDNIKTADPRGKTPLHEAVLRPCDSATVEVLLKNGGRVKVQRANSEGNNVLPRGPATFQDIISPAPTARSFQQPRTYIDAVDDTGSTALHLAIFCDEPDDTIVELLLKYGANVNGTEKLTTRALVESVLRRTEKSASIVRLLLNHNADVKGLRELGLNFQDYENSVGHSTATEIMRKLSVPQRRNTETLEQAPRRTLWPSQSLLRPIRSPTSCTHLCCPTSKSRNIVETFCHVSREDGE